VAEETVAYSASKHQIIRETVSIGTTEEYEAAEDHESPMDERTSRKTERFLLCPSSMVPA
jgi:hypothetical protein